MLLVRRFVNLSIILLVAHSCTTTTQDNSLRSQDELLAPFAPISIWDLIKLRGNLANRPAFRTLSSIKFNIFGIPTDLGEVYSVGHSILSLVAQVMTIWIFQNTKDSDPYATRDTLDELTAKVRVNELNRLVNNIQLAVDNYVANEQLKI